MSSKKQILKTKTEKGIQRTHSVLRGLIFCFSAIVIYDAFVYKFPFYYISFYIAGIIVGKVYSLFLKVQTNQNTGLFQFNRTIFTVVLFIVLILLRFVFGGMILKDLQVEYITDALYLFFIGIYRSKLNVIVKKVEDEFFSMLKIEKKGKL
ncbi:hypothetical protein KFZ70_04510 [Tamlana fucoidanivorans]|uniref:Uncharacterized protein n=1 Tax=Allotamlana fucoidanivorans TaxID=2583814 RepID=A0A5C4SSG0_9FLAO|nr:hypothetical protein [Tamlana fucoidanivorans]TNJ47215.1 hypothetical protein FGF67_01465 [Tamlana fucoidanivorans]